MKRLYYDLHLHSCLSPCGDNDMTPYNLVQMAVLNELDLIALTDHNSAKNCMAAMEVANRCGITLLPGMELCTVEEIHVVCLFGTLEGALAFDQWVLHRLPPVKNHPETFGEQRIMDGEDTILGQEPTLLVTACDCSIMQVLQQARSLGGTAYPAHIDRESYSVLSVLGDIPPECGFLCAEATSRADVAALQHAHPILQNMPLLLSSDAHYLEDIHPRRGWIEVEDSSPASVIAALDKGAFAWGRG